MATTWEVSGTTLTVKEDGKAVATVTGLKSGLKTLTDDDGNKYVDGIDVSGSTVTLTRGVLTNTKAVLKNSSGQSYTLAVTDGESTDSVGWQVKGTIGTLRNLKTAAYTLSGDELTVNYKSGSYGTILATLSGLKKGTGADSDGNIPGITVEGKVITVNSKSVLDTGDLTLSTTNGYTLAAGDAIAAKTSNTPEWTVEAGKNSTTTAKLSTTLEAGYALSSDKMSIKATGTGEATVTITGLEKGVTADQLNGEGEYSSAALDVSGSNVVVKDTSILTTNVKLSNSGSSNYTLEIDEDAGTTDKPRAEVTEGWSQKANNASATYDKTTGEGFYVDATGTAISKNNKAKADNIFTISGLPKSSDSIGGADSFEGLDISGTVITVSDVILGTTTDSVSAKSEGLTKLYTDSEGDVYYGVKKLTIKNGKNYNYSFALGDDVEVPTDDEMGRTWTIGSKSSKKKVDGVDTIVYTGTGSITFDLNTSDGWALDATASNAGKAINYVAAKTQTYATISGLSTSLIDSVTGSLSDDFELETTTKTVDGQEIEVYTGNILYKGGDADGDADTQKVYAVKYDGVDSTDGKMKVTLNESVFGGKNITIKDNTKTTGETYKLALDADYAVKDIDEPKWVFTASGKKITATLTGGKTAGYELDAKGAIKYTAAKPTKMATITIESSAFLSEDGKKAVITDDDGNLVEGIANLKDALDKATTNAKDNVISLDSSILDSDYGITSFALKNTTTNYSLKLVDVKEDTDKGVTVYGIDEDSTPEWNVGYKENKNTGVKTATGKATYNAQMTDGYSLSGTTVTYTTASDDGAVLVNLSGLNTALGYDALAEAFEDGAVTVNDKVVINDASIFGTNKIAIDKKDGYELDVSNITPVTSDDKEWTYDSKKGTAVYYTGTSAGWAMDKNSTTSATYAAAKTNNILASITGLSKNEAVTNDEFGVDDDGTIYLNGDMLSTTQVKLTPGTGQSFTIEPAFVNTSTEPTAYDMAVKGGTLTLTRDIPESWAATTDGLTINYTAGVANQKALTISGLNKSLTDTSIYDEDNDISTEVISFDEDTKTFKLSNAALGAAAVTLKLANSKSTENFYLELDDDVLQEAKETTEWVNSKGTATYKTYTPGYYKADSSTAISYTKETKGVTHATLKGLNTSDDAVNNINKYVDVNEETGVITVSDGALIDNDELADSKKKVTLTNGKAADNKTATTYTLELAKDATMAATLGDVGVSLASATKGVVNATLQSAVESAGYVVSDTKTISYMSSGAVAYGTLKGVAYNGDGAFDVDEGTKTVTVSRAGLGDSNLVLTSAAGYKLKLDEEELEDGDFNSDIVVSEENSKNSNGTYTLKGDATNSYVLNETTNTIVVTKGKANVALATVKGLTKEADVSRDGDTITIGADDASVKTSGNNKTTTITVDSAYGYKFNFSDSYTAADNDDITGATIKGGNNADNITAAGSNLLIDTGKGNDVITATAGGNSINAGAGDDVITINGGDNVLVYKAGTDGNDTVTGFNADTDKINLTAGKEKVTVAAEDGDAVITIANGNKSGKITIVNQAANVDDIAAAIEGKTGNNAPTITTGLADSPDKISDNYFEVSPQLSDVLGTSFDAISTDEFKITTDYTSLSNQQNIAYGGDKK